MKRSREQLIADAKKFAAAQDDLASRCGEDSQHWHHVALAELLRELASTLTDEWPDVTEDDPAVVIAARAIAEHGIGRPWNDFMPVNAYDVDHGDLIEYGRAVVAALRAYWQDCPSLAD